MRTRLVLLSLSVLGLGVSISAEVRHTGPLSAVPEGAKATLSNSPQMNLTAEQSRALLGTTRPAARAALPLKQIRPAQSTSDPGGTTGKSWSNLIPQSAKTSSSGDQLVLSGGIPGIVSPQLRNQEPCPNIVVENGEKKYVGPANIPNKSLAGIAGDDISAATPLVSLPVNITGTTAGYVNDYDEICPYSGSTSPDVVFSYSPPFSQQIAISLCYSSYDTKVYVYEDAATFGAPYACNDDFCGSDGFRSYIDCLPVSYGHTYYIVIDGFSGAFGDYYLRVDSCSTDCVWPGCSPGAVAEGEACAYVNPDGFNGGCDGTPVTFTPLTSGQPVCGTIWSIETGPYSTDRDWYAIPVQAGDLISASLSGNFPFDLVIYKMPAGCESLDNLGEAAQFPCGNLGFTNITIDNDGQWVFVITKAGTPQLLTCETGPWEYELNVTVATPPCEWVCDPYGYLEGEECVESSVDDYNGGCNSVPEVYSPIIPNAPICGEAWLTYDPGSRDTDWYRLPYALLDGDSVTWCVTADFDFAAYITDMRNGCGALTVVAGGSGAPCDTVCVGLRVDSAGDYLAFFVAPTFTGPELPCVSNRGHYEAVLFRETPCLWEDCPGGVTAEGESCDDVSGVDAFNGGCNSVPPVYSPISSGDGVCGTVAYSSFRDTDWYLYNASPGELITWCVSAEFAPTIAIIDVAAGCDPVIVDTLVIGTSCDWTTVQYYTASGGQFALFVAPDWFSPPMACADGPWEYVAYLNPGPECPWPGCEPFAAQEPETCIEDADIVDGGCNYLPERYIPITPDADVCGEAFWNGNLRDADWYLSQLNDGDSVTWCVSASFDFDVYIVDHRNGCPVGESELLGSGYATACDTVYLGLRVSGAGDYVFYVAPSFGSTPLFCAHGPWPYTASLDLYCVCDCAHNPVCDDVTDIFDVIRLVDVAFRNDPSIPDPNASCPWATTDVNCDGLTDIFDVTLMVNVAFRNDDPATEFCNPCEPAPTTAQN